MMQKTIFGAAGWCRSAQLGTKSCFGLHAALFVLLFLFACSEATQSIDSTQTESGSVSFNLKWVGGPDAGDEILSQALPGDCPADSVVEATIFSTENNSYKGGPWPCSARKGVINNVPVGKNMSLALRVVNNADEIIYYGEKSGIEVLANIENSAGDIVAEYSMPVLSSPENGASISDGNLILNWSPVAGATDYYFVLTDGLDSEYIVFDTTTYNNSYTLTSLAADTTYYWYVVARYSEDDYGLETDVWSFSSSAGYIPGGPPPAPAELYAYPNYEEMTISWSAVQGAEGYYLYYRIASNWDEIQVITVDNSFKIGPLGTDMVHVHENLTNGLIYSYAVAAYNNAGQSDLSTQTNMTPAWSNNYQPSDWENQWVSEIIGFFPLVDENLGDLFVIDVQDDEALLQIDCLFWHADGDLDMTLFDAAGIELDFSDSETDNEYIEYPIEGSGLHYIWIYSFDSANIYDLRWTVSPY